MGYLQYKLGKEHALQGKGYMKHRRTGYQLPSSQSAYNNGYGDGNKLLKDIRPGVRLLLKEFEGCAEEWVTALGPPTNGTVIVQVDVASFDGDDCLREVPLEQVKSLKKGDRS
jgi:hypothetical protein